MQDALAARLLNQPALDSLDRSTAQFLQKAGSGGADKSAQLKTVATEFEALFLSHMLNVMRETIDESGLTEKGPGQDVYTELFDQEVARSLANRGALGIADLLINKLSSQAPVTDSDAAENVASKPSTAPQPGIRDDEPDQIPDFHMPVQAHVSSSFGIRKDPFTHQMRLHQGVDIAAPKGMEVRAACAGQVVFSGYEEGYGNTVVLQHPAGFQTRYAHLGTLLVTVGDSLQAEQALGTVGDTGRSTGPHLHFEVSRNGQKIDPKGLLPE